MSSNQWRSGMCELPTPLAAPVGPCYSVHPSECPLTPGDWPVTPEPAQLPGAHNT